MPSGIVDRTQAQILRRPWVCAWIVAMVLTEAAHADAFQSLANQRNMLPGGRAALLGGAFIAVADDASATYYNPAGLALIKDDRFDLSATAYHTSRVNYHDAINAADFYERSQVTYPSFVGATARFGRMALGYSYLTLDAHNIYQQDRYDDISRVQGAPASYSRTYQERSSYIHGGLSIALRLSDSLSIGSSAFYYQRDMEYTTNELVQLNGGGTLALGSTMQTLNTGITGVHGIYWRRPAYTLGARVKMGTSLSDRSMLLANAIAHEPGTAASGAEGHVVTSSTRKASELDELNPRTYGFGAALHPKPWLLLSGDVLVHEGVKAGHKDLGGADLHTTVDYSVGLSLRFGPMEALGGFFTNNSMYDPPDPASTNQPLYINYVGHSGGLGFTFGAFEGYLGGIRQLGRGKAQIRNDEPHIQAVDGESRTYLIAGKLII